MVKIVPVIPFLCFFSILWETEGFDIVPDLPSRNNRQSKESAEDFPTKVHLQGEALKSTLQSMIDTIDDHYRTQSKEADETNRFAIKTISELMSEFKDQLRECVSNEEHLTSLSLTLESFRSDSKDMTSGWVITIQVFSSVGVLVICCAISAIIYNVYQRSVINKLLQKQSDICSNCSRLTSMAFEHIVDLSHSPPLSSTTLRPEPKDSGLPDESG